MYLARRLADRISWFLHDFPAVVITGARQTGKSTLAQHFASSEGAVRYDLESSAVRELLRTKGEHELLRHKTGLIVIDEVQELPDLFKTLRVVIDQHIAWGNGMGRFLLLGSSSGALMRQSGDALTGRIAPAQLRGFDCLEIGDLGNVDRLWDRGGFPRSYLAQTAATSSSWRNLYSSTIIPKSVADFGLRVSSQDLIDVLLAVGQSQGSFMNYTSIASALGMTRNTVKNYVRHLEEMMLVFKLRAHSPTPYESRTRRSKYYVCDSGLLHEMAGCASILSAPADAHKGLAGKSWEGFAIQNLLAALPFSWKASYFRSEGGHEIDLVIEKPGGKTWAVEFKLQQDTAMSSRALAELDPERAFLVTRESRNSLLMHNVEAISLPELMLELIAQDNAQDQSGMPTEPTALADAAFEVKQAVKTGASATNALRSNFRNALLAQTSQLAQEKSSWRDREARKRWLVVRNEICRWLASEAAVASDDPLAKFADVLWQAFQNLLAAKLEAGSDSSGSLGDSAAAHAFAHDAFVQSLGILLSNQLHRTAGRLLSEGYSHGSEAYPSCALRMPVSWSTPANRKYARKLMQTDLASFGLSEGIVREAELLWLAYCVHSGHAHAGELPVLEPGEPLGLGLFARSRASIWGTRSLLAALALPDDEQQLEQVKDSMRKHMAKLPKADRPAGAALLQELGWQAGNIQN